MSDPNIEWCPAAPAWRRAAQPLNRASTLPPSAYTSPATFARETDHVLRPEWLCAGRVEQVANPGDWQALDLLGEKLVVVRDRKATVRVLSRVCRHRGADLASGCERGNNRAFSCPYHAWKFHLDGRLAGAPLMEGVEDFDPHEYGLTEFRSEVWQGFIFVNLDGKAPPLGPRLEPLAGALDNYCFDDMVPLEPAVFDSPFNWKVLMDNFMEAYHHIAIHRDSFEPHFPAKASYASGGDGPYALLHMPARENADLDALATGLPHVGTLSDEQRASLVAAAVFPCLLFLPSAEMLVWYHVLPDRFDHFVLKIYVCLPRATLADDTYSERITSLREYVRGIHLEDVHACEAVWAGLTSPGARSGRLSILEEPLWHFNQWWMNRMVGDTGIDSPE